MVGQVIALALQFAAGIMIARGLGVAGFGVYSGALAISMLFGTLSDGGVTGGLTREMTLASGVEAGQLLGTGLAIKLVTSLLAYLGLLATVFLLDLGAAIQALAAIMGLAYMLSYIGQTAFGILRARSQMGWEAALVAAQSAIFVIWAWINPEDPIWLAWGWVAAYGAGALIAPLAVVRGHVQPIWGLSRARARQIWRVGIPLYLSALLLLLYGRAPVYLLTARSSEVEVGTFNAAFGLTRNLQFIAQTLAAALGPALIQLAQTDADRLRAAYTFALRTILLIMLPIAVGATALSASLITTLFGPSYAGAAIALALCAWAQGCFAISFIAQMLLVARDDAGRWFQALLAGCAVSVILGAPLAQLLGATGVSISALATELLVMSLLLAATRAAIDRRKLASAALRIGASALGMGILVWWLPIPLWGSIPLGALAYGSLLLITRAVLPDEVRRMLLLLPLPQRVRAWASPHRNGT